VRSGSVEEAARTKQRNAQQSERCYIEAGEPGNRVHQKAKLRVLAERSGSSYISDAAASPLHSAPNDRVGACCWIASGMWPRVQFACEWLTCSQLA
jgi:hypothetical protein